ncbi:hypothetical protein ACFL6U_17545 [Planctomycetota bacterium]
MSNEGVLELRVDKLAALAAHIKDSNNPNRLKEHLDCLQEGIDYLRVLVKYQAFDLEVTRRENAKLKARLEEGDEQF